VQQSCRVYAPACHELVPKRSLLHHTSTCAEVHDQSGDCIAQSTALLNQFTEHVSKRNSNSNCVNKLRENNHRCRCTVVRIWTSHAAHALLMSISWPLCCQFTISRRKPHLPRMRCRSPPFTFPRATTTPPPSCPVISGGGSTL
jgi:hypothetical protein